jgi:hypothetical protein
MSRSRGVQDEHRLGFLGQCVIRNAGDGFLAVSGKRAERVRQRIFDNKNADDPALPEMALWGE